MSWVQPKFTDFVIPPPAKKQKLNGGHKNKVKRFIDEPEEIAWVTKWRPKKKTDLVVNKKKVDEVEKWLEWMKDRNEFSVLLLAGPPGCGKLTTLRVLCTELDVNLVEWSPQIALSSYSDESNNAAPYRSEVSIFEDFVIRATRYSNVLNRSSCRLVVVKDIPISFTKDNVLFHDFLASYVGVKSIKLALITSDFKTTRELLSDDIKSRFNVKTIQFNPITQRNVASVLHTIAKGKFCEYINNISVSCDGDLRNAITTFHFLSVKGHMPPKKQQKDYKSDSIDLFHGLGRVLYAKRESNGKLTHCPVETGDSFNASPDLFVGMLQENYLETFSSIHDIAKASDYLAASEIILKPSHDTQTSRSLSLVLSSHALMSLNSHPIKKFQQFNKPLRIINSMNEFKSIEKDREVLLDVTSYGRHIPHFFNQHRGLFFKLKKFDTI